jgi:hypothetical protein
MKNDEHIGNYGLSCIVSIFQGRGMREKLTVTQRESWKESDVATAAIEAAITQYRYESDAMEPTLSFFQVSN